MKGRINIIKLLKKKETKSLNEFLNIKDIKNNYLYTLDGQVVVFIKVNPINIELLSDGELERKMDADAIEFSNEHYPYKILVIPRAVDLEERDIILLIKSFTIPEFARTEGTDYTDNIVKIKRKGV